MGVLGLVATLLLLLVLLGGYCAFWFIAAGRLRDGIGQLAESLREQKLDLSWRRVAVGGFPFAFRVELTEAQLRGGGEAPPVDVRAPLLTGSTAAWDFRVWRLVASQGLSAAVGAAGNPAVRLTARAANGSVAVPGEGGAAIWLGLEAPEVAAGPRLTAHDLDLWLTLPPHPPRSHTEPTAGVALDVRGLNLPAVPAPFRNPLDETAFGATLMGPVPATPPREAAAGWRDAGGTLELDHFDLRWGALTIAGSGTLALDAELQPIGGFSGGIEGYDELMSALVAAGRLRASDAGLAKLALAMLAKAGPHGRPQIATSFTIQNGEMFLGPAKLGKAPRIPWE